MSHSHLPPALQEQLRRSDRLAALEAQAADLMEAAAEFADEPAAQAFLTRLSDALRRRPCSLCQRGEGCDGPC